MVSFPPRFLITYIISPLNLTHMSAVSCGTTPGMMPSSVWHGVKSICSELLFTPLISSYSSLCTHLLPFIKFPPGLHEQTLPYTGNELRNSECSKCFAFTLIFPLKRPFRLFFLLFFKPKLICYVEPVLQRCTGQVA